MNKITKQKEIKKELTPQELLAKLRSTLKILRMKNKMGQLVKTHQIKQIKKEIAHLLTRSNSQAEKETKNK